MNVVSGPPRQPGFHLGVFVSGVVVHHQMYVQRLGDVPVDVAQERQKL